VSPARIFGPQAVPADYAERRAAVDPARSWVVQAPAGSGKTELLIQRYLALLAQVNAPESILAITFTRKAAGEMRERIAGALRQAAAGEPARDASRAFTLDLARQALEQDARAGWNLMGNPSRLRVQTIDSFCASVAKGLPWLAGFGAMPRVAEDAIALYREAARNTIRLVAGQDRYAQAMDRLALHLDNDLQRIQRMIEALLPKRDQWLRHLGSGSDPEAARVVLEAELARVLNDDMRRTRMELPDGVEERLAPLLGFAKGTQYAGLDSVEAWRQAAALLLTTRGEWRTNFTVRDGFPPEGRLEKRRMLNLVERLRKEERFLEALREVRELPVASLSERQWEALAALLVVLPAAAAELKLAFRDAGQVDFVEVAQRAREALGDASSRTDLALALGERIEHILLDEFQDTSVSQVELLDRLTAGWQDGDGRTLFLVGDPMQSIYRFREAEVGLFLRVRGAGLRADLRPGRLTLVNNFRTRPEVLEWVNGAFAMVFPEREDIALGAVPYTASMPFREASSGAGVEVHPFFANEPEEEAALVADLLQQRPAESAAVLVRARRHAVAIVRELASRGIAYRAVELDPLAERPAVTDLLALTRALLHPGDRTAWLALLRAPWCGASLQELLAIAKGAGRGPIVNAIPDTPRFARLREAMAEGRRTARRVPLRQCVEETWRALGGEATLRGEGEASDARRFLEVLEEIDDGGAGDLQALGDRVARLFAAPAAGASPAVEIMTIHKAKGLEFDTVIVPGLGYGPGNDAKPLLRWGEVPVEDGTALLFAPAEASEDPDDPIFRYLALLDRKKSRLESARLLYVAATRAREHLHLIGHVETAENGMRPPRKDSLLEMLWPAVKQKFSPALAARQETHGSPRLAPERMIRRLDPAWRPPERDKIAWTAPETPSSEEERVSFEWVGRTLRQAGTVVHECLERLARDPSARWALLRGIARVRLESLGVAPAAMPEAVSIVERAVTRTLGDERGRWILTKRDIEATEFAATIAEDGVAHRCVIDRTFVEDGIRWVIDFKSSDIAGGGLDAFLDNEVERYRARMERYRRLFEALEDRPVRLGLYFPLLGGWRAW
jgi:ATP-dependent exoDNAse (exonuclease V) beta subunit